MPDILSRINDIRSPEACEAILNATPIVLFGMEPEMTDENKLTKEQEDQLKEPEASRQQAADHPPTAEDKLNAQAEGFVYANGAEAATKYAAALTEAAAKAPKPPKSEEKSDEGKHKTHTQTV